MNRFLNIILFVVASSVATSLYAQQSVVADVNYNTLEELIRLAKENYPKSRMLRINEEIAKREISLASVQYLDDVGASYYYRPRDRATLNPDNPFIFNGFQIGVGVSLGSLFGRAKEIKQAKAEYELVMLESADYEIALANEVKTLYFTYIQESNDLEIKTQAVQDNRALFDRIAERFEFGEVDLEDYIRARTSVSDAQSAVIEAEVGYLVVKNALEAIIGKKLEEIEKVIK